MKKRVCIVGAGPSGLSVLYQLRSLKAVDDIEAVCYEKQSSPMGMWNYTWRTGKYTESLFTVNIITTRKKIFLYSITCTF